MENSQLIEALRLCPLFKGFSSQEMAELLSQIHYKLVDYSPKDIYVYCCPVNFQTAQESFPKPFRIGLRGFIFKKQAP